MKHFTIIWVCILLMNAVSYSQASSYHFTTESSFYTPLVGGTVLGTGQISASCFFDMPIGFTFYFNGQAYTRFSINVGGYIAMGSDVDNDTGPLSAGTVNNIISCLAYTLGSKASQSELRYKTNGSYPNRELVIQWSHFYLYGNSSGDLNFQIRLEESTNRIIFHYGTMYSPISRNCQVGIRCSSVNDYHNRTTPDNWSATTAGAFNSETCTLSSTIYPSSGLKFIFYQCMPPVIKGRSTARAGENNLVYTTEEGMQDYSWSVSGGGTLTTGAGTNTAYINWQDTGQQWVAVTYTSPLGCSYPSPASLPVDVETSARDLHLSVFLESLYSGGSNMRKAQNSSTDQFTGTIADLVDIELRNGTDYRVLEYKAENSTLHINGSIDIPVPFLYDSSYFITIQHRNSFETTSSSPVAFSSDIVDYQFNTSAKAFGNNLKLVNGKYCIYGGDVLRDGLTDASDMIEVDNLSRVFRAGYLIEDANGDGLVDSGDMIMVDNNSRNFEQCALPFLPELTTKTVSDIGLTVATSGGTVSTPGYSSVTARGVCWSLSMFPSLADNHTTDGAGTGSFTSSVSGLLKDTLYYLRAYASSSVGTAYGNQLTFRTHGTLMDYDSNVYETVVIGAQRWMVENLKVTHYRNGVDIEYPGSNITAWFADTTGAYAWINNDSTYKNLYGALYNYYAVSNPNNLCPEGWHVPSDAEYTVLCDLLGGIEYAGGKLKSKRKVPLPHPRWPLPNAGATNESGFAGFPGGYRRSNGEFGQNGGTGYFLTSTPYNPYYAYYRELYSGWPTFYRSAFDNSYGLSVRCLKD